MWIKTESGLLVNMEKIAFVEAVRPEPHKKTFVIKVFAATTTGRTLTREIGEELKNRVMVWIEDLIESGATGVFDIHKKLGDLADEFKAEVEAAKAQQNSSEGTD